MPFSLTKTHPRLWSLDAGVAIVVTDLHGDWDAYTRYRDRFVKLHSNGQADCLIFTGDLIHRDPADGPDRSIEIVADILALRARYGDAIIYLCGNHELPHLYGIVLSKGSITYTPDFEAALSESGQRDMVIDLFDSLPFFLRTAAGVCLTHAGAAAAMVDVGAAHRLFSWHHRDIRDWANAQLAGGDIAELRAGYARLSNESSYDIMARHYLSASEPDDPRYDDLLRGFLVSGSADFRLLYDTLFTRCEQQVGESVYTKHLNALLAHVSEGYIPQRMLVAGHMAVAGGHMVVVNRHLRLASATHARPREAGQYLRFDAARPIGSASDLLAGLGSGVLE
jgi:hypothetical protein